MDKPNSLHTSVAKQLIVKMGAKGLDNLQIDRVCKAMFGSKWRGCNSQDTIKWSSGYQIINVDTHDKPGTHWCSLVITPKTVYVYDSFGRPASKLLKILARQSKDRKMKIVNSELDAEQSLKSEICGHLSIAWLHVVKYLGIKQALKI